jgi:hypothetical protein
MTDTTRSDPAVRELPINPDGSVEISLTSNELHLRGTDTDRVVIRTRGGEPIDDQLTIEAGPTAVRIQDGGQADFQLGPLRVRARHTADLDIDIPRTVAIRVRTLSGDVDAAGIAGASRWATASGSLRVRAEGGPIAAESMSGDLVLESTVPVGLSARAVSGDVHVRAPEILELEVSTTSGDVDVAGALSAHAAHSISSVSGDVVLATGSAVRLEAQTVAGDIRGTGVHRAEGRRGHRTLVVGDGQVRVSVRTMSGDVRLREGPPAPETAPAAPASARPPVAAAPPTPPAPPVPTDPSVVVAEASAAPNLVRPATPAPAGEADGSAAPAAWTGDAGTTDRRESVRLDVLRALERGDLDVETASRRLEALEDAGPRAFRGWC